MIHVEGARVPARPVVAVEGQPVHGVFSVKPLMRGEHLSLLEVRVPAGASSAPHVHAHESLVYVVSGRLATTVGDESFVLGPGDACRHPAHVRHAILGVENTVFVEVKSPPPDLGRTLGLTEPGPA